MQVKTLRVALAGNPNCGKTSLFNGLTGLRHRIGNYPGITVEKVEGTIRLADGSEATLLDLPGCYSLFSRAPDERIARDLHGLHGRQRLASAERELVARLRLDRPAQTRRAGLRG